LSVTDAIDAVTVRRAITADAGRVRALRLEMLADTPLAYLTTIDQVAAMPHDEWTGRITRASNGSQIAHFIAEAPARRLVGQVVAAEHSERVDATMLFAVYVSPSHRGGAVLDALIEAAAAWSRECGRDLLELEVVTTNKRAARAYRKLGFTDVGEPVPHPTMPVLREQLMSRPLSIS
jgi:ribosomal protein S18 acetylase RimI-like enzyme